ncbi:hypothetical protein MMC13_007281 [Lambiella insularis]|nr:hypothetical protein [Lambiella insularis]
MSAAPPSPSQIAALQELAASLGAPQGTIPNYVDPPSIGGEITIPSIVLIVLATLFVCARLGCKVFVVKALAWDDFWSVSALWWIGSTLAGTYGTSIRLYLVSTTISETYVLKNLYLGGMLMNTPATMD